MNSRKLIAAFFCKIYSIIKIALNIIDKFIWSNYQMYPSTLISAGITEGVSEEDKKKFLDRIASYPKHLQDRVKAMYANAYFNKDK